MKGLIVLLSTIMIMNTLIQESMALQIVTPASGSVFHPGDKVTVKAIAAPEENPVSYLLFTSKMPFSTLGVFPPYVLTFTIPLDFTGSDKIIASAKYSDGNIVETEIGIEVVLPPDVKLENIDVSPRMIYLEKLPAGSEPNKVRAFETVSLRVSGLYSDNVKRDLTASQSGTTYTSSNEKVAVVSQDGEVTAKGIGKALVTVRNGRYSIDVQVNVDLYKSL